MALRWWTCLPLPEVVEEAVISIYSFYREGGHEDF